MAGISGVFYSAIVKGIEYGANQADYSLIFSNSYKPSEYETFLDRVDGLIIFSSYIKEKNRILELLGKDIPVVIAESDFSDARANCIYVDNEYGSYIAAKHLIELGHTRIGHIAGDLDDQVAIDRLKGYKNALRESGLPSIPELVTVGNFNSDDGYRAMKSLLEVTPLYTVVHVANDEMAFGH